MVTDKHPQFVFELNATGVAKYGAPTLRIGIDWELTFSGLAFIINEQRNGSWNMVSSFYDQYGLDINDDIAEMNMIGVVEWIWKHAGFEYLEAWIINIYREFVKVPSVALPPPPPPSQDTEIITTANMKQKVNAALMEMFTLRDVDGDGFPELVRK